MIDPTYVQMMTRYNSWQNDWLFAAVNGLSEEAREADRGLFWGSIRATLSHLMWGDLMWMSRFDGGEGPLRPLNETGDAYGWSELRAERPVVDARISSWAAGLVDGAFDGDLTWWSGAAGREMSRPYALCVVHVFNHQTHHRGQVHAALTALGVKTHDTDIPFLPEDA